MFNLKSHFSILSCAFTYIFKEYKKFSVITSKFEETEFEKNAFDLVYSASAFHWVPEEIGYKKVLSMLKSGGAFARFANHPYRDKGNPVLSQKIDELYGKYYYTFYNKKQENPKEYDEQQAKDRAFVAEKYGFTDIQYAMFYRTRVFSAQEYITLLGTYSDHIAMEESIRKKFFGEIEETITNTGEPLRFMILLICNLHGNLRSYFSIELYSDNV